MKTFSLNDNLISFVYVIEELSIVLLLFCSPICTVLFNTLNGISQTSKDQGRLERELDELSKNPLYPKYFSEI